MQGWRVVTQVAKHTTPPSHHVVSGNAAGGSEGAAFCNPWESWHKPSLSEVVQGLVWGVRDGVPNHGVLPNVASAVRSLLATPSPPGATPSKTAGEHPLELLWNKADSPLQLTQPQFEWDAARDRVHATWLGHASVLLQFPPLAPGERGVSILFDPIFSKRCSPWQLVGPPRYFPPPCSLAELPPIDLVVISHNHYDHLDHHTIVGLWERFGNDVHFVVPLGNRAWFLHESVGVAPDAVTELDWWDSVTFAPNTPGAGSVQVTCTPAQHSSGRSVADIDHALWASWYVEHRQPGPDPDPYRAFFGGDSGYRFRVGEEEEQGGEAADSSHAGPPARTSSGKRHPLAHKVGGRSARSKSVFSASRTERPLPRPKLPHVPTLLDRRKQAAAHTYPACPTFGEIADRLGCPDMLMLPVSVGATFAFLKSFDVLPDWISPFPRLSDGLTGANHMSATDAVSILQLMEDTAPRARVPSRYPPVCLAIHWGTFVEGPGEIAETIYRLETACAKQGVHFTRTYHGTHPTHEHRTAFALVNIGESIRVAAQP